MSVLFVLGGARSGKSRHAQSRAEEAAPERIFIATAQAFDDEMAERIARHQADRNAGWQTVEEPLDLAGAIKSWARNDRVLLIDCLTLWTSNLLLAERDVARETAELIVALSKAEGFIVLVANEVGLGIVPDNALARQFRDAAGLVNQAVAACADEVVFMAAGLPLRLK